MKILITLPDNELRKMVFNEEIVNVLEQCGELKWNDYKRPYTKDELKQLLRTTDICITGWSNPGISIDMLENSPLKFIGHIGGSLKGVVTRDIFDKKIKIVGCNRSFEKPLAEHTLMLLLMSFRRAYDYVFKMKTQKTYWASKRTVNTLYGKTIGILGYGAIAKEVVRLLKPFDVNVLVCDEYCTKNEADERKFLLVSLNKLLSDSDAITIHHTLMDSTYHLLDKKALSKMKDNTIIVNTARGAIIDENALIHELKKGRLFAALDVYKTEPLPANNALRKLDNVIAFPHVGGGTYECRETMGKMVAKDIQRFIKGEEPLYQETKEHYDRMTESIRNYK